MSRRILASYLTLALFVLLALAIPLAITFERAERRNISAVIERDALTLAALSEEALQQPDVTALPTIERLLRDNIPEGARVVIVRADGIAVVDTTEENAPGRLFATIQRPEIVHALRGDIETGTRYSALLGSEFFYVAVPVMGGRSIRGAVRITFPTSTVDAKVRRVWLILAALGVFVISLAAALGLWFVRWIASPLARVERASVAAGEGDLTVRAPVGGPPEVQSLAMRFNQMVGQVEELVRQQEAFVADASHQLRTPLAAMRLRLENLEPHVRDDGSGGLDAAITEVDRLNRLVDGLLVLSRPTGDQLSERIDLSALIDERVRLWSALGDEQSVRVSAATTGSVWTLGSPGRVEQVVDNLIENALEATPSGGSITVSAAATGPSDVELHVVDTGRGMSDEERARAFDRFWRSERNPADGSGLGLAIVRRLVETDGGSISLNAASGGGTDVQVRYRAARTPSNVTR